MIFDIGNDKPQIHPTAFVHPTAEISGKVRLGPHANIWGGCILRGDIEGKINTWRLRVPNRTGRCAFPAFFKNIHAGVKYRKLN